MIFISIGGYNMPVVEAQPTFAQLRPVFRLGVDAYHRMIDAGILHEDDRVELIVRSAARDATRQLRSYRQEQSTELAAESARRR